MDLLRRLVKSGPNADLRRLLFSNFTMLLSFLKMDSSETAPAATGRRRSVDFDGDAVGDRGGGRRLYFAGPVARLMGAVVDGDAVLVTSVSDEQLTQLARGAARSRRVARQISYAVSTTIKNRVARQVSYVVRGIDNHKKQKRSCRKQCARDLYHLPAQGL